MSLPRLTEPEQFHLPTVKLACSTGRCKGTIVVRVGQHLWSHFCTACKEANPNAR